LISLFLVVASLLTLMLFYPILRYGVVGSWSNPVHRGGGIGKASKELGLRGFNATGQVPRVKVPGLIDDDTPMDDRRRVGVDGEVYELVFSDEVRAFFRSLSLLLSTH
jgi:hypothetical protein